MKSLKVGPFRRAQRGDVDAMLSVLAHFMIGDDGQYMGGDAADALLDELTFEDLGAAFADLQGVMMESSAPKATAPPSGDQ